jgi:CDP-paratose 2-epimerase
MKILVTGGAGMIGYHVAKYYAEQGNSVDVMDNHERSHLLGHAEVSVDRIYYNSEKLKDLGIQILARDVSEKASFDNLPEYKYIIHLAAQCGVPTSIEDPRRDFEINTIGTFNVLEHARACGAKVAYASTNKVYPVHGPWYLDKERRRWRWSKPTWDIYGFPIDGHNELSHSLLLNRTPYGTSKYAGDLLCQEYYHTYGVRTGVFRMSCIYGDHQFGFAEQGWATWFAIATINGTDISIFGDGCQVRDMLWVGDVVNAYDSFLKSDVVEHGVWNLGGGTQNVLSLNECLLQLEEITGKMSKIKYDEWRPADQRIYTSDTRPLLGALDWKPTVSPREGLERIVEWVEPIKELF